MKNPTDRPATRILPAERIGDASDGDLAEWGLDALLAYWERLRGESFAPPWSAFDIGALPAMIRGGLVVCDHDPEKDDFRIRYWGVDLWDIFGLDLTGAWLSEIGDTGVMNQFREQGPEMLATREAQKSLHRARTSTGEVKVFPVLRLPISDDGERVTKIITARNARRLGRRT